MIMQSLFITCVFCIFSLYSIEEETETDIELLETPEEVFSAEEDTSILPKKGQRPQVIITPTKTSPPSSIEQ